MSGALGYQEVLLKVCLVAAVVQAIWFVISKENARRKIPELEGEAGALGQDEIERVIASCLDSELDIDTASIPRHTPLDKIASPLEIRRCVGIVEETFSIYLSNDFRTDFEYFEDFRKALVEKVMEAVDGPRIHELADGVDRS